MTSAAYSESRDTRSHLDGLNPAELARLLLQCEKGDIDAFDTFYRLTSPVLATLLAARWRLSPAAADAVLVEVYVTLWRRAHTFPDSGCSAWQWTLRTFLDALARSDENQSTPSLTVARPSQPATNKPRLWRRRHVRKLSAAPNT